MKVYIHYEQKASAGYTVRQPLRLFNVDRVLDAGSGMVKVQTLFSDNAITHDHVTRVVIEPESD